MKNLESVDLEEYLIVVTQEMIDKGRRKHNAKSNNTKTSLVSE
jgi:hypothetical protein